MKKTLIFQDYFLSYYCTFMFILSCLAEDINGATESKCQSYYPLSKVNELLKMSKKVWELRKSVYLFYFHVYCDVERESQEDSKELNLITEYVYDDFHEIAETYSSEQKIIK